MPPQPNRKLARNSSVQANRREKGGMGHRFFCLFLLLGCCIRVGTRFLLDGRLRAGVLGRWLTTRILAVIIIEKTAFGKIFRIGDQSTGIRDFSRADGARSDLVVRAFAGFLDGSRASVDAGVARIAGGL